MLDDREGDVPQSLTEQYGLADAVLGQPALIRQRLGMPDE